MYENGWDDGGKREQLPQTTDMFNVDEYQQWTQATAGGLSTSNTAGVDADRAQQFLALAVCGETGEVAEKLKKAQRAEWTEADDKPPEQYRYDAIDELGDVLWYVARLADELDVKLSTVYQMNREKLTDRVERNEIVGEGDDR